MKIHAFVDAENIDERLFNKGCSELRKEHELFQIDVFGKAMPTWASAYNYIPCFFGKNSADTFMTAAIVRAVYEEPQTDIFAIFSHDRDFLPAIKVITDNRRRAMIVTERGMKESHLKHIAVDMNYLDNIELDLLKKKTPVQPPLTENERKRLEKYELTTCFLKTQQGIVEVPFANGMELILFARIIPLAQVRSGYPKSKRLRDILVESHLKVLNDKVYIDTDHL
ncbi:hypothetical protein AXF19_11650 [Selenomonas sp. oral taxon 126]|uniref:NYN domain-containing protein n=1 Tax=Selenomonas sp. oral taxon 126 TaxID=712528 RepID=UPI000807714D|nr:NYN domain-containing protein [Selenomonas sp. oral taxon 126]ANR71566.1 hypothetical protein AXF19_11650 [Selenomonas sp. oral taxon 126]